MKQLRIFILIITVITNVGKTQSIDTLEWTVISGGTKAGFLKKWENLDGSFTEWFQYNDRGRGDSTVAKYRYDNDGYLEFIDASGVDYYKKPVFEKLIVKNGIAYWENNSEKEQKKLESKADYVPLNVSVGTSYKNYFKSPTNTIQLLPTGTSKLTVLKEQTLKNGKKVRLISTVGIGFTPSYIWIDENDSFFAYPGNWFAYLLKGYESYNEELYTIQKEYEKKYYEDLAPLFSRKTQNGIAVTNANLFNPQTGELKANANIFIENGKIKEVMFGKPNIPKDYQNVNANGKFVMPGLWDMHVHYGSHSQGLLHLSCGVTNVRDMGNSLDLLDSKKQIDNGQVLGPRIQILSGFIDGAGQYSGPTGEKINSIEEGKTAIKKYADLGYQQIKLYSSIKPEWVRPLADEAKKYNLRVSGHIPAHMLAEEAIESGYNEIQHMNMLFLNFYGKELDTRTPLRFTTVAQKAASFDFESETFIKFIHKLKQLNITIDPTVSIFEGMFIGEQGKISPAYTSIGHRFPLSMQRNFKTGSSLEIVDGQQEIFRNSFESMLKMVKILYDNNVTLVPGTDDLAGFMLHRELENYAKAGIPNKEILKMATVTSATVAGKISQFGTIEKGKVADLIIIDGDPTKNIEDIRKVEAVIKDNDIYRTKDLLEKISIKYFK